MPVWQRIYEEINDPNFVIVCAAEDTGGEAVAGPIFDEANPTYIQVVDPDHIISSVFNFVNVPSAAWVDEEGRIVRIDEGTYSKIHEFGEGDRKISFGNDGYAPALKDWVAKGRNSEYVQSAATVTGNIRQPTSDQLKADAAFRLANLFRAHGQKDKAEQYWEAARPRIHYAVNCASIGCPNLATMVFTGANVEDMLTRTARDYVNNPRGAELRNGRLVVSSIYEWYKADFGDSDAGVIRHLRQYAGTSLASALDGVARIADDDYDWALNEAERPAAVATTRRKGSLGGDR